MPAAQLRERFADKFKSLRQLGVAVPSGIEIAYRIVDLTMERLTAMAIDEPTDWKGAPMLPAVAALDFSDSFARCSRTRVLEQMMQSFPTLY